MTRKDHLICHHIKTDPLRLYLHFWIWVLHWWRMDMVRYHRPI